MTAVANVLLLDGFNDVIRFFIIIIVVSTDYYGIRSQQLKAQLQTFSVNF